jgi:hypothetical protein
MNARRITLRLLACATLTLAFATLANAQATRTWVSGVGDDVNPCSRTAPCKTFAGAISKTADKGEIDALDPGGFGTITITKNITIEGTDGQGFGSILAAGTTGVVVNDSATATPNTIIVTLRNLSINGAGTGTNGIRFLSGKAVNVEDCQIANFNAANGFGIEASLTAGTNQELTVKNTTIFNNLGSGVRANHTAGTLRVTLDHVQVEKSANGVLIENGVAAVITNSRFALNTGDGVFVNQAGGNASANLDNSVFAQNGSDGIAASGPVIIRASDNYVSGNIACGVNSPSSQVQSFGNNKIKANTTDVCGTIASVPAPIFQ